MLQIAGQDDLALLAWATQNDRVLLTHDLSTMIPAMRQQLERSSHCSLIVLVPDSLPTGMAIEDILMLESGGVESDWTAGVVYLPLK
ncbi:MAG: hypothetical protein HYR60_25215 [Acidobacteria bacterium]|nr:hypothetical protein [Acidobacteriota bacterium]